MTSDPVVWHASGLTSLMRCGIAYRRRFLDREQQPPTTPQIRGSAVHRGVGAGLLMQRATQEISPPELMEDVAASEIDRARHGGATLTAEEASVGTAKTWGALKDKAVRFAGAYARLVAPTVRPLAVERRVTVADVIPGVLLRGTIDLVDAADYPDSVEPDDPGAIRDEKTTERAPSADAADRSQQLTMYDLLRSAEDGTTGTRPVSLDYLVLHPSTGTVQHHRLNSHRGPRDRAAIVGRIQAAVHAVAAGAFLPADPETAWWCSERYCEYWSTCPYAFGHHGTPRT